MQDLGGFALLFFVVGRDRDGGDALQERLERIRGRFVVAAVEAVEGGFQVTWKVTVERENSEKPCCVAAWRTRSIRRILQIAVRIFPALEMPVGPAYKLLPLHFSFCRTTLKNEASGSEASGSVLFALRMVTVDPRSTWIGLRPSSVRKTG